MVWPVIGAVLLTVVATVADAQPRVGRQAPAITGQTWINSAPLTMEGLKGRVVLVEFWTHG
ncbi:MAG: hypothetical protein AUH30_15230 [Candidatus Rokubacteria bacterium 13_1_40CM_68_15]|nr:MAG: hypothetical protein AUH30_15230 [Candidatus Rokubacteria bacterium 13_1_40CM_68_15]